MNTATAAARPPADPDVIRLEDADSEEFDRLVVLRQERTGEDAKTARGALREIVIRDGLARARKGLEA